MLDQIAEEEDDAKRGMLAAIVVAEATMQPGDGFYTLAKKRGCDISSKLKCWFEELSQVWKYWRRNRKQHSPALSIRKPGAAPG